MEIQARLLEKTPISHLLHITVDGEVHALGLVGNSKFRLVDSKKNWWDSNEIDFTDSKQFSVNIFERLICCFSFNLDILKYLMEQQEILEAYINKALSDIDMTDNVFKVSEVPIARRSIKLRAYLDYSILNKTSVCILTSPEYKNLITKQDMKKKMGYIKAIANKEKIEPSVEKVLRSIDINFQYDVKPMTPIDVEKYLEKYLQRKE